METIITHTFPVIVAILALIAGIIMLLFKNWGSAIYWFSACAITFGVIMIPKWG